jgi:integrase
MPKRLYSESNPDLFQYRKDGNYYCRVGDNDICLETNNLVLAEAALALQRALTKRFGTTAFKFKIKDLFPRFLKEKKKSVRDRTYKLYESIWRVYFEKLLGKVFIGNMNQRQWTNFCAHFDSVSDFQNHRNLMHQFLIWCQMHEFILAVPVLKNPKHKRRKRRVIPPQHLIQIFQHAHGSLLLFVALALFHGMRRGEIMTLDWRRISLPDRYLILSDDVVKTGDGREVPIAAIVHSLLVRRLQDQQDRGLATTWVFPHAKSPKKHADLTGLMSAWRRCLLHCGLAEQVPTTGKKSKYKIVVQYTWHDLRATYEKHAHKSSEFTDTQKEKMVGADIDVQKKIYVTMGAEDLRGLEEVVSKEVPELVEIIANKTVGQKVQLGTGRGKIFLKSSESEKSDG